MINLHHLSIFHAVARTHSMSRGAEALLISQPAVSKQLLQLEKSVKAKLFDRRARGVDLTAAGSRLADYSERIFNLVDEAEQSLRDLAALRQGSLSVGAGPTVGVYLLPGAIVQFRRDHPQIRLRTETEGAELLRQRLLDGMIEMAISEFPIVSPELVSRPFTNDLLVPVVAGNHTWARDKTVSAHEFCHQPFIARQVDSDTGSLVERTLATRGFAVQTVLTVGSTEAIKQAVIAGLGVAMISKLAIRAEVAAGLLVALKIRKLSIRYPIYQSMLRGRSQSSVAREFLSLLCVA